MILPLNVPFLPDPVYARFLAQHSNAIQAVHFALPTSPQAKLHSRVNNCFGSMDELIDLLALLPEQKKYLLFNTRFVHPGRLGSIKFYAQIIAQLEKLHRANCLTGIIFADFYFLSGLSEHAPELAGQLEAVPSVNCHLDSFDKIRTLLNLINRTQFALPGKLALDRSLNRQPAQRAKLVQACRKAYPEIVLELLANEGCLLHCPFKPAHDAHISLANINPALASTHLTNQRLGCIRLIAENPELLFQSPFIRPEDSLSYANEIDSLKICGRTLGPDFLIRVVSAYLAHSYRGNLLDLLDTLAWLAPEMYIDNTRLPGDFLFRLSQCKNDCRSCSFCKELLVQTASKRPLVLPDLRNDLPQAN